jgi:hypothetical protein
MIGWSLALAGQSVPPVAGVAAQPGSIAGRVSERGVAQAGVPVAILRQDGQLLRKVYSEPDGHFRASRLAPGVYAAVVLEPSFLPFWKGAINVLPGAEVLLDIPLLSIAESVQISIPASAQQAQENWKWVLRSSYPTRPVLRFQPTPIPNYPRAPRDPRERALRGTVQIVAGNESSGFGQDPGLRTSFDMAYVSRGTQWMGFSGSAGWESGTPAASLRASWNRRLENDGASTLSVTIRELFLPLEYWVRGNNSVLSESSDRKAISGTLGYEETKAFGERVQVQYGSLVDVMNFAGHATRWSPFARVTYTPAEPMRLTLAYVEASPRVLPFDWNPEHTATEQWLAIPQLSAGPDRKPTLETGRHIEASWEESFGTRSRIQGAVFYDDIQQTALSLAHITSADLSQELLQDPFSDRYFLSANDLSSPGLRVAFATMLSSDTEVIAGYGYSGTLAADSAQVSAADADSVRSAFHTRRDHSIVLKVNTSAPWTKTKVSASYRWLPRNAAALPDPYDRGWSQSDPYLNIFLLQPIPSPDILPGQFQAVADFNNLLAQGYLTIVAPDGSRGYLFPSARSFRGGVSFVF